MYRELTSGAHLLFLWKPKPFTYGTAFFVCVCVWLAKIEKMVLLKAEPTIWVVVIIPVSGVNWKVFWKKEGL